MHVSHFINSDSPKLFIANVLPIIIIRRSHHIHAHTESDANLGLQHFPTSETPEVVADTSNRSVLKIPLIMQNVIVTCAV